MKYFIASVALYLATAVASPPTYSGGGAVIQVQEGQKIQDAINSAKPGTRILVAAGTYPEQLLIKKDGISLEGQPGTILSPPANFTDNRCTGVFGNGTQAGICIKGSGIVMDPYVTEHRKVTFVRRPVHDVSISGFTIQGFQGANILALGAYHASIVNNTLIDGGVYGFLTSGSYDTYVKDNVVTMTDITNPGFIALCMDNFEGAYITANTLSNYLIGFCIQTPAAVIHNNSVSFTCKAAFVDPFVRGIKFYNNHISSSYPCGGFGSYGVVLSGATNSLIQGNTIEGMTNDSGPAAGVQVLDDPCTDPELGCLKNPNVTAVSSNNRVVGNTLTGNQLDLLNQSSGSGNVFKKNTCSTSSPDGLC